MAKAIDIANIFIELAKDNQEDDITNLRVNKLIYFAQGGCLSKLGKPLFDEDIQAWNFGPVVPEVYFAFQKYGRNIIEKPTNQISSESLSSEQIDLIIDTADYYRMYSSNELVNFTHKPDSPWRQVYTPGEKNIVIPKDLISRYFKKYPLPEYKINYSKLEVIGRRDENGNLILPVDETWTD